jgi:3',5'-cyclic AMP phosphodiesterase CpdA
MMNRREALARLGSFMAAGLVGSKVTLANAETSATLATSAPAAAKAGQPLTIAHITDVHITDLYEAEKWVAKALHMIQDHPSKPSLIINTGDCVMDSLKQDKKRADELWKIWNDTFKRENSLPVRTCLGNHDVWGGRLSLKTPFQTDPQFGKKLALDSLGMEKSYYSFDFGGWHFIMLDTIYPIKTDSHFAWVGQLDDKQLDWLKKDIAATPAETNIVIGSHIPILQVCSMWGKKPEKDMSYRMPAGSVLANCSELISLFTKHPNVKLCLSGHIHRLDRVQLHHATYICDGSMCAGKWRGQNALNPAGFSITTLNPDGTFDYNYHSIDWHETKKA